MEYTGEQRRRLATIIRLLPIRENTGVYNWMHLSLTNSCRRACDHAQKRSGSSIITNAASSNSSNKNGDNNNIRNDG